MEPAKAALKQSRWSEAVGRNLKIAMVQRVGRTHRTGINSSLSMAATAPAFSRWLCRGLGKIRQPPVVAGACAISPRARPPFRLTIPGRPAPAHRCWRTKLSSVRTIAGHALARRMSDSALVARGACAISSRARPPFPMQLFLHGSGPRQRIDVAGQSSPLCRRLQVSF